MRRSALSSIHSTTLVRIALTALVLLLATASCTSVPNPYGFKRGPYLQMVSPDSVLVVWDTAQEEVGRVEYGPTEALGQVMEESQATRHHALELTGLAPYSSSYYRVGQSQVFSFRSAAAPDQTRFRFAVIGDTQQYHKPHAAVIAQVLKTAPDWFIHLGDMTEHGESAGQWDDFFGVEAPLLATTPSFTTIGNHQRDNANYYTAFHLPGNEHWCSFAYGNARFICLEGDGYPEGAALYTPEELAWLEAELATNTSPWLFVFQHRAVFSSAAEDNTETGMRLTLQPLFERYGVDVFLSGHKHNYERLLVNGITYIVSGGGGGRLTAFGSPEPSSQKAALAHHFVLFEVDGVFMVVGVIGPTLGGSLTGRLGFRAMLWVAAAIYACAAGAIQTKTCRRKRDMTLGLRRRWWQLLLLVLALAVLVFVGWASIVPAPMPEAIAALQPAARVSVETTPWLVFQPAGREPEVGLILYPGGRVDPRAYAPAARAIAAQGYLAAVVPMPLHLAVFGVDRAKGVIEAFPTVQHWAVGGHSLGGSMAAQFARKHPDLMQGLVLWASFPGNADDLSASTLKVTSISGTQDGLSTPKKIEASRLLLPADTRWVAIEGGNHGQFGWYGSQSGDNVATITREAQQEQVVAATVELLTELQ